MALQILSDNFDVAKYNAVAPHPLQAWEWGMARVQSGVEVIRIGEFENTQPEKLLNVFQMTLHSIPHTSFKIGYLPRSVWPSQEALEYLFELGTKNNLLFIKFEPNVKKINPSHLPLTISHKLIPSPHPLFPQWTMVLDLRKTEEELLAQMKPKTRYNIRLAQKKGVTIKEMSTQEGFEVFIKLYFETCKRQKYFGHTEHYHQVIWDNLKEKIAHILVAYYENIPLAAYELFSFNNTFYYPYGGSSLEHRNVMGANLLMWEAIRLGQKLGAQSFDMWGALAPEYMENNPWAGFTKFKEGYGAEFTEMIGSYDLVMNSSLYKIYTSLYAIRGKILSVLS